LTFDAVLKTRFRVHYECWDVVLTDNVLEDVCQRAFVRHIHHVYNTWLHMCWCASRSCTLAWTCIYFGLTEVKAIEQVLWRPTCNFYPFLINSTKKSNERPAHSREAP
jgi:hypothetical protein